MITINNNYLSKYVKLDKDIKEKEKEREEMKKQITLFLNKRKGKELITQKFIAFFQNQKRTVYVIPEKLKPKYAQKNPVDILKVQEKKKDKKKQV